MLALALTSCTKERIQPEPEEEQTTFEAGDLGPFFAENAPETQTFVIDSGDTGRIIGKEGTEFMADLASFEYADADTSVSDTSVIDSSGDGGIDYPYSLQMIEIYTPGNMIFGQMLPLNNTEMLETVGEVFIQTYHNDRALKLSDGEQLALGMPLNDMEDMKVFYSATTGDDVNFIASTNAEDQVLKTDSNFLVAASQMGWIGNQDYIDHGSSSKVTFRSDSIPLSAMKLYVHLKEKNAVYEVKDSLSQDLGIGDSIQVVAFAIDAAGTYYKVIEDTVVEQDQKYKLNFVKTDGTSLASAIKAL